MNRSQHRILSASFLITLLFATPTMGEDWPQWRGKERTGISKETGWIKDWPDEGLKQLWKNKVGVGWSSISVADGKVYTMGNVGEVDYVYAFDVKTGKLAWDYKYPCSSRDPNGYPGTRCTPTVDGDRVYTVSREGHFYCFNTKTGEVIWSKNFQRDFKASVPTWGFSGSPLVEGDKVIFETGASGAAIVALNKMTGELIWKTGSDRAGYGSPVGFNYKGQRAVALFSAFGIHGFNARDGKELFRHPWKTSYDVNAATPVVEGETVFISSGYNRGCSLVRFSSGKPEVLWENKNMRNHMNACVLWEGHLYGFDENDLKCLDYKTGKVKWSEGSFGKGSLIIADGQLIILSDKGELALAKADPSGFKRVDSFQALGGRDVWQTPALANGIIYARNRDTIAAFDVRGSDNASGGTAAAHHEGFIPLFPEEGIPKGWEYRAWDDVKNPGPEGAIWKVKDGVLHGGEPRLTWLVSDREYSDFTLKFEWKLGEQGNGGCGLRFPGNGDPAFDGLELQMVDPRYYGSNAPNIPANELTGSLYRAVAPTEQLYKPGEWNSYEVTLKGPFVKVILNGKQVLDVNLDDHNTIVKRHNGQDAVPLKDRPRKGHIGFQDLSRGGSHVQIRNAMIKELK